MPAISYTDWSGGLDRRLSVNSQDANKLWTLRNAYITTGKRIRKRECLKLVTNGLSGSYGLGVVGSVGTMVVFCDRNAVFTPPVVSGLTISRLNLDDYSGGSTTLARMHHVQVFLQNFYVVAGYADGTTRHHYLDQNVETPRAAGITIASPGVVTVTAHGFPASTPVVFSTTGGLPTGLVAGTTYYVSNPTANTFEVSATAGGASINTSGVQSGSHDCRARSFIGDLNCPHTDGITKAVSRIFAPRGGNVHYCAAGSARDWSSASDAGFLPAALEQDGSERAYACGTFQNNLVVIFESSSQVWNVAVDPSANAIAKRMYGTGTTQPMSLASFANDLVFLSPFGFRSMTAQQLVDRIDDNDVGVPIDSLVTPDIATTEAIANGNKVRSFWIAQLGQYWAVFDMGTYSKAWVYTFSKSSKIACWSEYVFPVRIHDMTTMAGKVYLRDDDNLYEIAADEFTDNGTAVSVEVQMAFQDAKLPGVAKQFWGADMVSSGSWGVSYKFDSRDDTKQTGAITVSGDTRPGDVLPVDVVAPSIAPVFTHSGNEAASIDALTMYFHSLAAV